MALIRCLDCGHDVSDRAPACVNCGRPLPSTAARYEICEVALRRLSDGGLFGNPDWVLEGQVMTPKGIAVVASRRYSSDNDLANFQGSKPDFHQARQMITNDLLRAGWEPLPSVSGGAAISLPRFQRPYRGETQQLVGMERANRVKVPILGWVIGLGFTGVMFAVWVVVGLVPALALFICWSLVWVVISVRAH